MEDGQVLFATVGKFSIARPSIAPNHRPGGQAPLTYRSDEYFADAARDTEVFDWRRDHAVASATTSGSATAPRSCRASPSVMAR
jgi:hypothetical protein